MSKIRSDELKLFVFICTMYPEDSLIPIEHLVAYGMSLNLFKDVHDMIGARDRIHHLFRIINQRVMFKLHLEGAEYKNQYIKMDVGSHAIAKKVSNCKLQSRFQSIKKFPAKNEYKNCYGLSLAFTTINEHASKWKYPKLALLLLTYRAYSQSLPTGFFKGMEKLRILSLDVLSLPQSLRVLTNLRFLKLKVLNLQDVSSIGGLANLEFLIISTSTACFIEIPMEMRKLRNLRLLDLRQTNLAYITPGVLSKMLQLEELYLPLNFRRWGSRHKEEDSDYDERREKDDCDGEDRINASLDEISSPSLNALQVSLSEASMLCMNSKVVESIQHFRILVLSELNHQLVGKSSTNELQLTGDVYDIKQSAMCNLINKTADISLVQVRNLKSIMYQLQECEFLRLKKMIITKCDELEYLVNTDVNRIPCCPFMKLQILHLSLLSNLKGIWNRASRSPLYRWFSNLREIKLRFCHKIKYVFPESIGKELIRLNSIEILDCSELEGIFVRNEVDDNTNGIYYVEELCLYSLSKFLGFLVQRHNTIDGTNQPLTTVEVSDAKNKNTVGRKEMQCAFSSELMNERLIKLKKLKIAFCDALNAIFCFEENHDTAIRVLNSLEELELYGLRNLKYIWYQIPQKIMAFQGLQLLTLSECHNSYLFTVPMAKLLGRLQKVLVSRCEKMEEIVAKENEIDGAIIDETVLPMLKALELQYMSSLKIFSRVVHVELPSLEFLKINECNKMEIFSCGSSNTPMLEKVQKDGISYPLTGDLNATLTRLTAENL